MIGCPVAWKCFNACWFFALSQHPTWPQVMHTRNAGHVSPSAWHAPHTSASGVTARTKLTWLQGTRRNRPVQTRRSIEFSSRRIALG